jgi:exodeoxyribonuclease VII large subunit
MEDLSPAQFALSLSQLNGLIKSAIMDTLPDQYWVVAEIADIKLNQKGHCYLELVEKEDGATIAQVKGTIWAYEYRSISNRFHKATNEQIRRGMKVLFLASVSFHEVYGLSLNIRDIDPTYTMGEMARKKKEVIDRLRKEGLIDRNRTLDLPLVPQRIAVISSPTAAGYEDFFNHLDHNAYGYRYVHTLFPALMQGLEAEKSIIRALTAIAKVRKNFDLVVIIRGGGSVIDLNCFDGHPLASLVAMFPLPVITGIGHEKDDTVVDIVAHTKMKTPTAVAEFLISGARSFEESVLGLENLIVRSAERLLKDEGQGLISLAQRLSIVPVRFITLQRGRLLMVSKDIAHHTKQVFISEQNRISSMDQAVRHLDPLRVLRRGFSITTHKGQIIKNAQALKGGMTIETLLHDGKITSIVQSEREAYQHGKKQGTDLLPGFE